MLYHQLMQTFPEMDICKLLMQMVVLVDPAEAISVGPSVTYRILFQNTGVYHWYARCSYADWDSDSYHLGGREINATDTVAFEKMNPYTIIGENWNEWGWNYQTASGAKAAFTVTEAGYHEITVLLREPNFRMDKIVLSLDDSYYPWEYPESEDLGRDETAIEGSYSSFRNCSFRNQWKYFQIR